MARQNESVKPVVEESPQVVVEQPPKKVVFFALPAKLQFANFRPEEISGGRVIREEVSLEILDHVIVLNPAESDDREKIDFIKKSGSYDNKTVYEVDSLDEAVKRRAIHKAGRSGVNVIDCQSVTTSPAATT